MSLLEIDDLSVGFGRDDQRIDAVRGVSLAVDAGETLAIVGESGSGKTVTALSLLGLHPPAPVCDVRGSIRFDGRELVGLEERAWREIRGADLSMIFQDPTAALNPVIPIGRQIEDAILAHESLPRRQARARALEALRLVQIPDAEARLGQYVHQFSGGMRQRAAIALAISTRPRVLIADEPTTALDVAVQAHVLEVLLRLQDELEMALVLVTHDLGVVAQYARRVAVMYGGRLVEVGSTEQVLGDPQMPYSWALLEATPRLTAGRHERLAAIPGQPPDPRAIPAGCAFAPRCPLVRDACLQAPPPLVERRPGHRAACILPPDVLGRELSHVEASTATDPHGVPDVGGEALVRFSDVHLHFPIRTGVLRRTTGHVRSVDGISLELRAGETLALVGESGSGKTSLARTLMRLEQPTSGAVSYEGIDVATASGDDLERLQREVQVVFQNPYASLDPRATVEQILREPLAVHGRSADRSQLVALLATVGLPEDALDRRPHAFSGGQRQRIAIARALALEPRLVVCDEAVSALDVSIQAQVLNLLRDLQRERGLSYLFISHDLGVVRSVADRIAVMYLGQVVEYGTAEQIYRSPRHPYTKALLMTAPADPRSGDRRRAEPVLAGELPSPADPPPGCRLAPRCPRAEDGCHQAVPPLEAGDGTHPAACFIPLAPGEPLAPRREVVGVAAGTPRHDRPEGPRA